MVPDEDDGAGVQLAKKVCLGCSVGVSCLLAAEDEATRYGADQVQGVRGGLTAQERATWAGLGRWPAPCTGCGLDCVPIHLRTTKCSACNPRARVHYADYREQIVNLIKGGWSYEQIGVRLHLGKEAIAGACARWKLSAKTRSNRPRRDKLPCGTLAAKYRHHRKEKKTGDPADGFKACPKCRHVPWQKGGSTPKK
jgi:hypothetical protein